MVLIELVLVLELLDTSSRIDDFLRTCKEGVALIADVDRHRLSVGLDSKLIAAGTSHFALYILRMDSFFHFETFFDLFGDGQPTHSGTNCIRTLPLSTQQAERGRCNGLCRDSFLNGLENLRAVL